LDNIIIKVKYIKLLVFDLKNKKLKNSLSKVLNIWIRGFLMNILKEVKEFYNSYPYPLQKIENIKDLFIKSTKQL